MGLPPPRLAGTWLSILGLGEDGVEGLGRAARALIEAAELVVGGVRHLALAAPLLRGATMPWPSPIADAVPAILGWRGRRVVVLASGDPFWFGAGSMLARAVPAAERRCVPAPSAFSLAAARLGWTMQDVATISFCGRPLAALAPLLQPGARILALSADAATPAAIAAFLRARGFGASGLHVLEALGGLRARVRTGTADKPPDRDLDPLNLVALEIVAGPGAQVIPLAPGLPDAAFEHDGQITKREVRALTLAALAPRRGEHLWDVGCGAGSVAIEWLLRHPAMRATGIERHPDRAARAARNAIALGVPALALRTGAAPAALAGLAPPDAVFLGGGAHLPGVIASCWAALPAGGRIVANAVTVETGESLFAAQRVHGGTLTRLAIERLDAVGTMHAFRPAMPVVQWAAAKP